jgi:hypothetical protein
MITNRDAGTSLGEIADGIFCIKTPVTAGGLTFNQYLVADEAPMLFHTGLRRLFPLVRAAIGAVLPAVRHARRRPARRRCRAIVRIRPALRGHRMTEGSKA